MSTAGIPKYENTAITLYEGNDWVSESYRFHVAILTEDDDSISIIALNLPGVVSCGESEEEALKDFAEAAGGVLESYVESGSAIPWVDASKEDIPSNARVRWILVNA